MIRGLFLRHLQVLFFTLGQLWRSPWSTTLSVLVIAISLTLPSAFYLLLEVTGDLSSRWRGGVELSLYLHEEVDDQQARELQQQLQRQVGIAEVDYVSAEQALDEFRSYSGLGVALDLIDENPLPATLRVKPVAAQSAPEQVERWLQQFAALEQVESAEFDAIWVQRLHGIVTIGERLGLIMSLLLGAGVVLIIGNTIRLAIFSRRDEIEINKLIGATDAFIRRPFLYSGLVQGFAGGMVALLMIYSALALLAPAVGQLAGFYQSEFTLSVIGWLELLLLPLLGALLGYGGAWLAVGRHLREIEPG